ncbi:MAG: dNTP triphosphohydrolase, partial [Lachnospiraceae bacterium]|nr:dNTP triphosphohydrolase [Lachnospiraceae bacterium]
NVDPWFEEHLAKEFSDILLCAGLIHDIGNPPFGHFGEYAIREWFQKHLGELKLGDRALTEILSDWQFQDLYNFEGNAQSIRLLSKTPYLGTMDGFNLSYPVLGAIMKYPISSEQLAKEKATGTPLLYKKIGYNYSERELFDQLNVNTGMNGTRHPLSFFLEAADDIAYRTSDVEDSLVKKVTGISQMFDCLDQYLAGMDSEPADMRLQVASCIQKLRDLYQNEIDKKTRKPELAAVQRWNQYLQEIMIRDASDSFVRNYQPIMEGCFHGDLFKKTCSGHIINAIAVLSEKWIYTSSLKIKTELYGRRVIDSLLTQFMPAAIKFDTNENMTFIECRIIDTVSDFYKSMYRTESEGKSEADKLYLRILMITDFISGMTDNYAKRLYQELFA